MAELAAPPGGIDPRSGYCAATRTFHSVRAAGALPPESLPTTAVAYAFLLLPRPPSRGRRARRRALAPRRPHPPLRAHVHRRRRLPRQPGLHRRGVRAPGSSTRGGEAVGVRAVLYSSGTTGRVKAVAITHRNLISLICAHAENREMVAAEATEAGEEPPPPAVTLLPLPLFHVFGFMMVLRSVSMGKTAVLMERFDFGAALRAIERYRVTLLPAAPPLLVALINLGIGGAKGFGDFGF